MATHSTEKEGMITKTFKFKVDVTEEEKEKYIAAMREYGDYYNKISNWICDHLNTATIGNFYQYMSEKIVKDNPGYLKPMLSEEWRDQPMYKMFMKGFNNQDRDNILFAVIKAICPDNYSGNTLGMSYTNYARQGYISSAISNYVSRFSNMKPSVKQHKLTDNMSDDEITEQVIYEMQHSRISGNAGWEKQIEYLEGRENVNDELLSRIKFLASYYREHEDSIKEKIELFVIRDLQKFNSCHRDPNKLSMMTTDQKATVEFDGECGLNIKYTPAIKLHLLGHKGVIKNFKLLFDIGQHRATNIVLNVVGDELYANISSKVPFSRNTPETNKVVGIDINIKHMLLMTNIKDNGQLNGYVNIYKEALSDPEFVANADANTKRIFKDFSTYVTFCPTEFDLLYSREAKKLGYGVNMAKVEMAFTNMLNRLHDKYLASGESEKRQYVDQVISIRNQELSYARLKNVYYKKQSEYDFGKDEEFIHSNPFIETTVGQELKSKLNRIDNVIIANRDGICEYAYKIISTNGYDMIALEDLTSSQFEKIKTFPSVVSLLNYHHVLGDTMAEYLQKSVARFKDYYNFQLDSDGKICGAALSSKGEAMKFKADFFNQMMKAVHFADIKDKFCQLQNNGHVAVALVPSFFTSQMDSISHSIYTVLGKNGNQVLASKERVRPEQEKHINGLNADYNAACNIAYIVANETFRDAFLKKTSDDKLKYSVPAFTSAVKTPNGVISKLKGKKMNAIIELGV